LLSPSRAIRKAATTGHALPEIAALRGLYERGVSFRGSQLVMVTGRPKAGKSNLVQ
jgi:hypothetical protein